MRAAAVYKNPCQFACRGHHFLNVSESGLPDPAAGFEIAMDLISIADSERCQCKGIVQLAILAHQKHFHFFADGSVFERILEIADRPTFGDLQYPMYFFEAVTRLSESHLLSFASQRFFVFLLGHFFSEDTDIASQVLLIWANIVNGSDILSRDLITADWVLAVIARACADFDRLYLPFMELASALLRRCDILGSLEIDVVSDIRDIIVRLLNLHDEGASSVAVNCLRTVSAVNDQTFVIGFFSGEILESLARATLSHWPAIRDDALAAILGFSALGDFALERLLESGYAQLQFDGRSLSIDALCCMADAAINFLSAPPRVALAFLQSPMMDSLLGFIDEAPFDVKIRIANALCFVGMRYPLDLVALAPASLEAMLTCVDTANMGSVIQAVQTVCAMLGNTGQDSADGTAIVAQKLMCALLERDDLPNEIGQMIAHDATGCAFNEDPN
jgi:hypothetical protein